MSDEEPTGYWPVLEPVWNAIDIYSGPDAFLDTLGQASPVQQVLFAAHFCWSEVSNGGFHQFFTNPTGVLAPEAAAAFRRIGMPAAGSIVEEAMAFFGKPYPRDQEERCSRLEGLPGKTRKEWDPFYDLDDRFYTALGPNHEDLGKALDHFASSGGRGAV